MASKNQNTTGISQSGIGATGAGPKRVFMPANNVGNFPVKTGAGIKSPLANSKAQGSGQNGVAQKAGKRANMPSNNITNKNVTLGTTKHSVGSVPHYLRNSNNSGN